jgi:hypothetical protein
MVEERRKQRVRRFPLADLVGITLRTRALVSENAVILTFRDGGSLLCSDWAPVGLGSQRQERGRLVLTLGILLESLAPAQRAQVACRVEHSMAAVTMTAGLTLALVAGCVVVINAVTSPWPQPHTSLMEVVSAIAGGLTVIGGVLMACAAGGWPTQTRPWSPATEGLPEGWRLNRRELYEAMIAHVLWGLARADNRAPWPWLLPPQPNEQDAPAQRIEDLLTPAPPAQESLVLADATWRRTADHLERTTPQGCTRWPLAELRALHWRRGFGRRTLTLTMGAEAIAITHTPRNLATWAAGLRTTQPAATGTVEEEALRRLLCGILLSLAILGGLALAALACSIMATPYSRGWTTDINVLLMGIGMAGGAMFRPPRWLKTSPGRRRWTTGDPEGS